MPDEGQSKAAYIIICSGRIDVLAAKHPNDRVIQLVKASSDAARNLVSYYRNRVTESDTVPISDLQHEMMEHATTWNLHEAEEKVADMFALLDDLEERIGGY